MTNRSATRARAGGSERKSASVLLVGKVTKVPPGVVAYRRFADVPTVLPGKPQQHWVMIISRRTSTDDLIRDSLLARRVAPVGSLLTLDPPRPESVPALAGFFRRVLGASAAHQWLPLEELISVLGLADAADRFIGGTADARSETLALVRGNLETLVVPFEFLEPSGDKTRPDFSRLAFEDHGQTIVLGDYEASADGILYEFDEGYRRRLRKERQRTERTFGASLRRLRLQRGLNQRDFAPLAAKTIARIERGDVDRPHGKTLDVIATRLGVNAKQIESY